MPHPSISVQLVGILLPAWPSKRYQSTGRSLSHGGEGDRLLDKCLSGLFRVLYF